MSRSWSDLAPLWADVWAGLADPVRERIVPGIEPGMRVLDIGCGTGELLALAVARGAEVAGLDQAEGMLAIARDRLPGADLRAGGLEALPWEDRRFDIVTAINALQFADDLGAAVREAARVCRGRLHVSNWGLREDSEINLVDDALVPPPPGGPLPHRVAGALGRLAREAGLTVIDEREVEVPFALPDDATLVRAFRFDAPAAAEDRIVAAAAPYRRPDGSYRFQNRWHYLVAAPR